MLEDREYAVRERAHAIWEHHGRPEGKNLDHWLQAEAEIGTERVMSSIKSSKAPGPARVVSQRFAQSANGRLKRRARP